MINQELQARYDELVTNIRDEITLALFGFMPNDISELEKIVEYNKQLKSDLTLEKMQKFNLDLQEISKLGMEIIKDCENRNIPIELVKNEILENSIAMCALFGMYKEAGKIYQAEKLFGMLFKKS